MLTNKGSSANTSRCGTNCFLCSLQVRSGLPKLNKVTVLIKS